MYIRDGEPVIERHGESPKRNKDVLSLVDIIISSNISSVALPTPISHSSFIIAMPSTCPGMRRYHRIGISITIRLKIYGAMPLTYSVPIFIVICNRHTRLSSFSHVIRYVLSTYHVMRWQYLWCMTSTCVEL